MVYLFSLHTPTAKLLFALKQTRGETQFSAYCGVIAACRPLIQHCTNVQQYDNTLSIVHGDKNKLLRYYTTLNYNMTCEHLPSMSAHMKQVILNIT